MYALAPTGALRYLLLALLALSSDLIPGQSAFAHAFALPEFASSLLARANPGIKTPRVSTMKSVVYFANWDIYGRNFQPQQLPADKLTHILYAFANVNAQTGEVVLSDTYADLQKHYSTDSWNDQGNNVYGCIKQLFLLKKKNRHLKIMLSIGGWTYSGNFAGPASTAFGRSTFVATAVSMVTNLGLDGIDIDWEYPADAGQGNDFLLLLQQLRQALNKIPTAQGDGKKLISIAVGAAQSHISVLPVRSIANTIDFFNLMAYDYDGSWATVSGHQANVYNDKSNPASTPFNSDAAIKAYIAAGAPSSKIVLGMPLYGRAFDNTAGPGQPFNGVGEADEAAGSWEAGVWDYKALPRPGASEKWDNTAGASYSYDPNQKIMISYDDTTAARFKANYIRTKNLGGAMWWEASGDKTGSQSLITTVTTYISPLDTSLNSLHYPNSEYANLRAEFPSG